MKNSDWFFVPFFCFLLFSQHVYGGILVDPTWVSTHLNQENFRVLDISRDPASFEKRHIPGALQVFRHRDLEDYQHYPPVGYPQLHQFLSLMKRLGISNQTTVVAYDDNRGIYASRMVFLMQLYGHSLKRLKILNGGIKRWIDEGLRVEKGPARPGHRKRFYRPGRRRTDYLATWQEIYRKVVLSSSDKVLLLDVRPESEYDGETVRLVRGGHIPGAINLEVASVTVQKDNEIWKSPREIESVFRKAGISRDKDVIIYCHSGDRSAHAFVILKDLLYYPNVRIYERAWEEWAVLRALPIEE